MADTASADKDGGAPLFSMIIGLVSTEDGERILETLDALRQQHGQRTYEVILADRRNDAVSERIAQAYPEARLIGCAAQTSLPVLRTLALDQARGTYVVVTEDHCVPAPDWLEALDEAFRGAPEDVVAVGGCVENGVTERGLDWATFLCEYAGALAPVAEGRTHALPGMNVAYRRAALAAFDRALLTKGFWETTLHPEMLRRGLRFHSTNKIVMNHCKRFSFKLFAVQRFLYSRYYAGIRFAPRQYPWRAIACLLSVLLPFVLFYRIAGHLRQKRRHYRAWLSALPTLIPFLIIWSIGEMAGYLLGPGDALARIE
ncbi:MAG: glycosyltransferase [Pseudomonadota bacterium]